MLNYKASHIARAERELDANFFTTLEGLSDTPSFTAILMLLRAGGLSEQEADDLLDEKSLEDAMKLVVEGIQQAGFLAKMTAQANQAKSTPETSQTSGAKTKA